MQIQIQTNKTLIILKIGRGTSVFVFSFARRLKNIFLSSVLREDGGGGLTLRAKRVGAIGDGGIERMQRTCGGADCL